MLSILLVAILIGMKHALEADHVAAVTSLATRSGSTRETLRLGVAWGLGHTMTVFGVGTIVLLYDSLVPEFLAQVLELAVGFMLIVLGADVIRRMMRDRVHFHVHTHGSLRHFHAHSHLGEKDHASSAHDHAHPRGMHFRALFVGIVHGMAGSAALVLLTLGTISSIWMGILYMLLFGLGSIVGMAVLSFAIAVPLRLTATHLTRAYNGLALSVGLATMFLGGKMVYQIGVGRGFLA